MASANGFRSGSIPLGARKQLQRGWKMINDEALQEYSMLLERNGFTIWETKRTHVGRATGFMYSQIVDGIECFGSVYRSRFPNLMKALGTSQDPGYEHLMPIRPSIEDGSSMFVQGAPEGLTLEAAKSVARPFNSNPVVGRKANWDDPYWRERLYTKREGSQHV